MDASLTGQILGVARACGKCILLGEHFVVHGAPAMALPVASVATEIRVEPHAGAGCELVCSADLPASAAKQSREMLLAALRQNDLHAAPQWRVVVQSSIPMGHGLGSSAAFSVALVGAVAAAAGQRLEPDELRDRAHALERLVHGTPSGIDDAVVTLERPVWFTRGEPVEILRPSCLPQLVLASSGAPGNTGEAVAGVHRYRDAHPRRFGALCTQAEELAQTGRAALLSADGVTLGQAMNSNHALLQRIGVSTKTLDHLVQTAQKAGALGAKLTGSGRGGFIIALVDANEQQVTDALKKAGAAQVFAGATDKELPEHIQHS